MNNTIESAHCPKCFEPMDHEHSCLGHVIHCNDCDKKDEIIKVLKEALGFYANCKEVKLVVSKTPVEAYNEKILFGSSLNYCGEIQSIAKEALTKAKQMESE